jgi:hypothetical protein
VLLHLVDEVEVALLGFLLDQDGEVERILQVELRGSTGATGW